MSEFEPKQVVSLWWRVEGKNTFVRSDVPLETAQEIFTKAEQNGGDVKLRLTTFEGVIYQCDDTWGEFVFDPNNNIISNN